MKSRVWMVVAAVCLLGFFQAGSLGAASYKFTDLMQGFPNDPGNCVTALTGANQIVGYYDTPNPEWNYAYFGDVRGGSVQLPALGGNYTISQAFAINKLGQIVGCCTDSQNSVQIPCVWTDPTKAPTQLALLPGYTSGYAFGINDSGLIVGCSWNPGSHACKWTLTAPDQPVDLGDLGGPDSEADGVNNAGQIVGWATNAQNKMRACIWNAGQTTPQDLANSLPDGIRARMINNQGHVLAGVNNGFPPSPTVGAPLFYWSPATGPINPGSGSFAVGLSDSDEIVGTGTVQPSYWYWTPGGGVKDLNQMIVNLPQGITVNWLTLMGPKGNILGAVTSVSYFSSCLLTPIVALPGLSLLLMS